MNIGKELMLTRLEGLWWGYTPGLKLEISLLCQTGVFSLFLVHATELPDLLHWTYIMAYIAKIASDNMSAIILYLSLYFLKRLL